ncbi:MAG TPA: efflux RND transporter periplasmic adaptor subunit [Chitinophagaceae bacterium]|nr:efflux RND transporter periplasmic adaptor subunit [Chitinophagaceae bacterium]HNF71241.1 efflux RND transporter periplasmic adaptor subunit [Chitinophagaceae bacterium]
MTWKYFFPLLLIPFCFGCKQKSETLKPTVESITETVYASGMVKSLHQYQVFARANSTIKKLEVSEGQVIHRGDLLAVLSGEASKFQSQNAELAAQHSDYHFNSDRLDEAKLAIDMAGKKMQNDSLLVIRQRKLWASEIGSKVELEQRELAYQNAVTAFETAQLRYSELKKQLELASAQGKNNASISRSLMQDYEIRSEMDGRVYQILKEEGEMTGPQSPMAIIGDAASFMLVLQVDEKDIVRVVPQQEILVTMDSYKDQVFKARVHRINPMMNDKSRTFEVEALFEKAPEALYPNLSAETNIVIHRREKTLTIPRTCLVDDQYVIMANQEKRKIKTGLRDFQKVEVLEGLKEGEEIRKPTP